MTLTTLTPREQEILATAIQRCLQNPDGLKINYKLLAQHCSFGTEGSARASWNGIRRKIMSTNESTGEGDTTEDTGANKDDVSAAKPAPKKRARKPKGDGPPAKRAKKSAATCNPYTDDTVINDEAEDMTESTGAAVKKEVDGEESGEDA